MAKLLFQLIQETMTNLNSNLHPSYLYGNWVGYLMQNDELDIKWVKDWLIKQQYEHAFHLKQLNSEDLENINQLLVFAKASLLSDDLTFQLEIPGQPQSLEEQIITCEQWVQGFIVGFSESGIKQSDVNHGDMSDIIFSITEISRMDVDAVLEQINTSDPKSLDEVEKQINEIQEFLKVSIVLMKDYFHSQ